MELNIDLLKYVFVVLYHMSSFLKYHRIMEQFGLGGTSTGPLVQPPCSEQEHLQLDQAAQSPVQPDLSVSRDEASTTSLGNQLQCFTTLVVKNCFLISSLNLPPFSLKPLLLVLLQQALLESLSPSISPAPFKN